MELEGSLPLQVPATCPYPNPDQSIPCSPIPLPENPSLFYPSFYTCFSQVVSFNQVSPPKPCRHFSSPLLASKRATCPSHFILLGLIIRIIFGFGVQISKLLIMCISPLSYSLVPLRPKFPPPHLILKHPQPSFPVSVSDQVSHPYKTTDNPIVL